MERVQVKARMWLREVPTLWETAAADGKGQGGVAGVRDVGNRHPRSLHVGSRGREKPQLGELSHRLKDVTLLKIPYVSEVHKMHGVRFQNRGSNCSIISFESTNWCAEGIRDRNKTHGLQSG